jgi:predicted transcriptional regulator of viral defense system
MWIGFRRADGTPSARRKPEARSHYRRSLLKSAARRLALKGRLVAPRRGFYVIVPLEYVSAGAPPASWCIDALMKFQEHPYYVGLLSAAALHGAAHQQPQELQVISDVPLRPVVIGRERLHFFLKRRADRTPTLDVKTNTGTMRVSTPEATAFDLVRYLQGVGHLGNVATVLTELVEKMDGKKLVDAAQCDVELSIVQRLGFVLDQVAASHRLTDPLAEWVQSQRPRLVSLRPDRPSKDSSKDARWLLRINEMIEADE